MKAYLEIEMPKSCYDCNLAYQDEDSVYWTCAAIHRSACMHERLEDCPLVPVMPHGDLIDRDALLDTATIHWSQTTNESCFPIDEIEYAPTIIPASEEGE